MPIHLPETIINQSSKVISKFQVKKNYNWKSKWISNKLSQHHTDWTSKWISNVCYQYHDNWISKCRAEKWPSDDPNDEPTCVTYMPPSRSPFDAPSGDPIHIPSKSPSRDTRSNPSSDPYDIMQGKQGLTTSIILSKGAVDKKVIPNQICVSINVCMQGILTMLSLTTFTRNPIFPLLLRKISLLPIQLGSMKIKYIVVLI